MPQAPGIVAMSFKAMDKARPSRCPGLAFIDPDLVDNA
ncbi:hypothetical protein GL4_1040 [Methyloceanibacter caenitepidi]|uniref:Uncharacterized protein n=1 Tax=Methyloceanibacter caenitepidi TaxID=1384459 RepID=A0A0A8K0R7_9HYPH|nr:hypothetical protein GL4_1040 [Methyloceanibacter caenitepidi]